MLERLGLVGCRVPKVIFVGVALIVCFAASACSGSESTTSEETTTTQATSDEATTAEDANLPAYASTLQPQIEEQMTNLRIPGALVYVDVPGEGTWSQAFGTGNIEGDTPITPNDHFRIGSNTKTFTGTVILQLGGIESLDVGLVHVPSRMRIRDRRRASLWEKRVAHAKRFEDAFLERLLQRLVGELLDDHPE